MRVYTKIGDRLYEGKALRKRDTVLKEEGITAAVNTKANMTPQQALTAAKKAMNRGGVDKALIGKVNDIDNVNDGNLEGDIVQVDVTKPTAPADLEKFRKMPGAGNLGIIATDGSKTTEDGQMENSSRVYTKDTIYEMRRSGVKFSKKEFSDFLKKL